MLSSAAATAQSPDDGLRTVNVKRFGITVRTPVAWNLITWSKDQQAFVLRLPQEDRSSRGLVSCELTMAPETLDEMRRRIEAEAGAQLQEIRPGRLLISNQLSAVDAGRLGADKSRLFGKRLDTLWEIPGADQSRYELDVRLIGGEMLYLFSLVTDQEHFDAYRADFEDMLAGARIAGPETSVRRLPGDLWMQHDYRFALRLPTSWRPAFGASDKVLFYAVGKAHPPLVDNLTVRATAAQALDVAKLRESLPRDIAAADPQAVVTTRLVKQGGEPAVEAQIQTKREEQDIVILERRFRGPRCNYEVRVTCAADEFKQLEPELRKSLDSFCEVDEPPSRDAT